MTAITRKLQRVTSDKRFVVALEPGDKISVRPYRHRSGFVWSVADVFRVMASASAEAEVARRRAVRAGRRIAGLK